MKTIRINASHPSQGPFVVINIGDFDPTTHEPFDQDDVDALRAAPVGTMTKLVDNVRTELDTRNEHLEAQAARQRDEAERLDAEAARQREQADELAAERARLTQLAQSLVPATVDAAAVATDAAAPTGKTKKA